MGSAYSAWRVDCVYIFLPCRLMVCSVQGVSGGVVTRSSQHELAALILGRTRANLGQTRLRASGPGWRIPNGCKVGVKD